jgi:2,4-dienoyl-CoA reductase-like NADH-dependent reductase (Old Yellow Enzyme family)
MIQLSSPLVLPSGARLPNRIVKAAMSEVLADRVTGSPTESLVRLYARWAKSGAGLLLSGNVMVSREGRAELGQVVVENDRDIAMLRRWADAAQAHGARLWMQINHAGRQSPRGVTSEPVAPSAVPVAGLRAMFKPPRALGNEEIEDIIRRFAVTARIAKEAGFSGVQIHAAHGYLASQFLSPRTNLRDDAWGGDPKRRMRFLLEIVRAVHAAVGPAFPVGVKLNSADFQRGGFTEEESMNVVVALANEGVDLLEISGGNYERPVMMRASSAAREAYFLDYAERVRARTKMPLLLTGGMRTRATMESVIARGAVDAIGLARPMAYEPDLPAKLLSGESAGARVVSFDTGLRLVDDMLQNFFPQAQLARIAAGMEPDTTISRSRVLFEGLVQHYL